MVEDGIVWLDACTSTNDEAASRANDPRVLAVAATSQTQGRGRAGRSWHSPPNSGLYLSWIGRPSFPQALGSLIPLMAAVSVAEVCDSLDVTVSLKWPNDVLIEGRKLAGILCEARGTPQAWTVVVGIGLNIFRPSSGYPEDIPAIALDERTDHPLDPKAIAPAIVQRLDGHLRSLSRDGAAPVLAAWERRGYPLGSSLRRGDIVGTFAGLTDEGALRLKTETGIQTVHAGDVDIIA